MKKVVGPLQTKYGNFYAFDDDLITNQLKTYGAHTRNEIAMILDFLYPGDVVIDVGAHIGTVSIPIATKVGANGHVYAFEANPNTYELLQRNIEINNLGQCISAYNCVVTDRTGRYIFTHKEKNTGASFLTLVRNGEGQKNNCVSLDMWFDTVSRHERIDFMKIDVEGMELSVIQCAKSIIRRSMPVLYVEISENALDRNNINVEDIEEELRELHYEFFRNIGARNSAHDEYEIASLQSLRDGGRFFDLLAVQENSSRRPDPTRVLAN